MLIRLHAHRRIGSAGIKWANFDIWKLCLKMPLSVILLENDEIVSEGKAVAEIFNDYFADITSSLGIEETGSNIVSADGIDDPVELAIIKYSLHPSIKRITESFHPSETFEFRPCSPEKIMTQIERLDPKKASPIESIPARVLKENSDLLCHTWLALTTQVFLRAIFLTN